jgi:hypothetical protein
MKFTLPLFIISSFEESFDKSSHLIIMKLSPLNSGVETFEISAYFLSKAKLIYQDCFVLRLKIFIFIFPLLIILHLEYEQKSLLLLCLLATNVYFHFIIFALLTLLFKLRAELFFITTSKLGFVKSLIVARFHL